MSVPAPLRKESRLAAQVRAEELVVHTLRITSNPNVFDPKYQALIDRVVDCAVGIGQDMWEANGIRVGRCGEGYDERRRLQDRAVRRLNTLLYLMTVSRRTFHLRSRKYEHWAGLARDVRSLAAAWRDSDAGRYGHLKSGRQGC